MKAMIPQKKRFAGFSLVELAIALLIMSILMSAGLSLATVKREAAQREATQKNQEAIKQALISYLGKNQRLPCPADPAVVPITGAEGRSTTTPPCAKYSGVVPYAELGLDRTAALDGWENYIDYVVSPPVTPPAAPPYIAWLYTYNTAPLVAPPCSPTIPICLGAGNQNQTFWPSNPSGSLNVTGNSTLSGVVVALISHGKNGYGAVNIKGVKNDSSAAGTDEKQNINPIPGTLPNTVVKRDTSDSPAGNAFDDVVTILNANDLTGPLITNGTFPSTQAALTQANNILFGKVLASKSYNVACGTPTGYFLIPAATISGLGIASTQDTTAYICLTSPADTTSAYTLTASDNTKRTVTVGELRGVLGQAAGFN